MVTLAAMCLPLVLTCMPPSEPVCEAPRPDRVRVVEATAYTPCDPGDPCTGRTAANRPADPERGIVAINRLAGVPFKAWVYVFDGPDGPGWHQAEDRICWRTCDRPGRPDIDILTATRKRALAFGRRDVMVYVAESEEL